MEILSLISMNCIQIFDLLYEQVSKNNIHHSFLIGFCLAKSNVADQRINKIVEGFSAGNIHGNVFDALIRDAIFTREKSERFILFSSSFECFSSFELSRIVFSCFSGNYYRLPTIP